MAPPLMQMRNNVPPITASYANEGQSQAFWQGDYGKPSSSALLWVGKAAQTPR